VTEEKKELNTPNEKKLTPQKSVDGKTEGKSRRRPARKKAPVAAEKKNVDIAATQPVEPKQSAAQKESGSRENRQPKQKSPSQRGRQGGASKQGSSKEKTVSPAAGTLQEKGAAHSVRAPHRNRSASKEPKIRIAFLGGLNEIGKNITLYETDQDIVLVDCGMAFPEDDMPGIDMVIPDFSYLEKNRSKIRGIVLTHGHEDHIGALPYLLKIINIPVYGTRLTLGLVEGKLREHGILDRSSLNVVNAGQMVNFGSIQVEFIHVNHSIPDAVGFGIHTPAGTIVMTGDFKIDTTPIQGEMIDLARFAELGREGVLALLSDSTNAERPGFTASERTVGGSFDMLFQRAQNDRIIIATFASNIHRVQQIINCAQKYGRKVALSGRSMVNVMSVAMELGYLDVPDGLLIDINALSRYPKEEIVLITTGSQGEPMSALSRMAFSDHRMVEVGPGDFIIISANPIPGNEKTVGRVINELMKRGCEVVYESMYEVHVSGHACQGEIKTILGITKPKYFIPVHGEQKHLQKNAAVARSMGIDPANIFIGDVGRCIELSASELRQIGDVPAGRVLVDGLGVGDVGSVVLRDRKHLAQDGLLVVVCTIDQNSGHIISGPDVVSRGFVYVREAENLMNDVRDMTKRIIETCADHDVREWGTIKTKVKESVSRFLFDKTKRNPMILPVIMEV
jgi:ribonuclease J